MEQSVQEMTKDMTAQEQATFAEALEYADILIAPENLAETLDGMNADDFIAYIDKECKEPHFRYSADAVFRGNNLEAVLIAYVNTYGQEDGKVLNFNQQIQYFASIFSENEMIDLFKSFDGMTAKKMFASAEKRAKQEQAKR